MPKCRVLIQKGSPHVFRNLHFFQETVPANGTADAPILMEVLSMKRRGSDGRAQVEPGNRSRGAKKQEAQVCFGPEGNADVDPAKSLPRKRRLSTSVQPERGRPVNIKKQMG